MLKLFTIMAWVIKFIIIITSMRKGNVCVSATSVNAASHKDMHNNSFLS